MVVFRRQEPPHGHLPRDSAFGLRLHAAAHSSSTFEDVTDMLLIPVDRACAGVRDLPIQRTISQQYYHVLTQ